MTRATTFPDKNYALCGHFTLEKKYPYEKNFRSTTVYGRTGELSAELRLDRHGGLVLNLGPLPLQRRLATRLCPPPLPAVHCLDPARRASLLDLLRRRGAACAAAVDRLDEWITAK